MVDYHTHTSLCGHANGTVDEYVKSALRKNIREIGFADHAPLPESIRAGLTMSSSDTENYITAIERCKQQFGGSIAVKLGFEVDYPPFESFDERYFSDPRIDYLIGSCHFIDGWAFDHPLYIDGYKGRDIDDLYTRYFAILEKLTASGLFNIVGHFDIVKKFGYRAQKNYIPAIEKIANIMARHDCTVEINTNGLSHPVKEMYPSDDIIKILFNCNVPVTFGSDAHSADRVGYELPSVIEKLRKIGYQKISGFSKRKRYDIVL